MRISPFLTLFLGVFVAIPAAAVDWRPVDPAELALKSPRVDPDADAEAISWDIWITDKTIGRTRETVRTHYLRVKIFTERGAANQSVIDLASVDSKFHIHSLRGRTLKADGTIVPLKKANIFQRTLVKAAGVRARKRSFSMPNVQIGDVIEYQWKETYSSVANNLRLYLQRDIPTWKVTYHVKPSQLVADNGYTMSSQAFNIDFKGFEEDPQGYWTTTMENMPAFKDEPYMPPDDQVQSWVLLFYTRDRSGEPDKYWKGVGERFKDAYALLTKADGAVKREAARIVAGTSSESEKITKILNFCRDEIQSVHHDRSGLSGRERSTFKKNKGPSDTLKQGMGTGFDVNMLFTALARGAGLRAYVALVSQRDDRFFQPAYLASTFLNSAVVAVEVDGEWRFYDPGLPYLEKGMLYWPEEGVQALLAEKGGPHWLETPFSSPERTAARRTAKMKLLSDGTLEGVVTQTYSGHFGVSRKNNYDGLSEKERSERVETLVRNRLSTAELSDIQVENADSVDGAFAYSYKVRVPGYAVRTGKRMFLQPSFFERGAPSVFSAGERRHDIYFNYSWIEEDRVTIELPEGFVLSNVASPKSIPVEEIGDYRATISVESERTLVYERKFLWGMHGNILFPAAAYPQIKEVFDRIHNQDQQAVTLQSHLSAGVSAPARLP